jgi:hypothetical protein
MNQFICTDANTEEEGHAAFLLPTFRSLVIAVKHSHNNLDSRENVSDCPKKERIIRSSNIQMDEVFGNLFLAVRIDRKVRPFYSLSNKMRIPTLLRDRESAAVLEPHQSSGSVWRFRMDNSAGRRSSRSRSGKREIGQSLGESARGISGENRNAEDLSKDSEITF